MKRSISEQLVHEEIEALEENTRAIKELVEEINPTQMIGGKE